MKLKKDDFIEIEYTGKLKEVNLVFDTTNEEIAKQNRIHDPKSKYNPKIVILGEHILVKGLDEFLIGKDLGKYNNIELTPELAFGKKDAKLIQIIPQNVFIKHKINPMPGLQIDVDGKIGLIKTISGGPCIVDFNNPLSGKEIIYDVEIKRIVTDIKEKADAYLELFFGIPNLETNLKEGILTIKLPGEVPKEFLDNLTQQIQNLIPEIKKIKSEKIENKL